VVLGVNIKEAPKAVNTYIAKHRLTFPHLLDGEAKVASMLAVPGTPATLLVNQAGQVLSSWTKLISYFPTADPQFLRGTV
jgi:peroxiredoxin